MGVTYLWIVHLMAVAVASHITLQVVPPATNPAFPIGTTPIAWHQCAEMPAPSLEVWVPPARTKASASALWAPVHAPLSVYAPASLQATTVLPHSHECTGTHRSV
jgi:hypothetical protein